MWVLTLYLGACSHHQAVDRLDFLVSPGLEKLACRLLSQHNSSSMCFCGGSQPCLLIPRLCVPI